MERNLFDIAEISIRYSYGRINAENHKITSSKDANTILRQAFQEHMQYHEAFYIMLLNNNNLVLGVSKISEGGITGTVVDVRLVFQRAIKANACAMILAHNHPSGVLKPSDPDKSLTKKLKSAGELLDIKVLDHLILTEDAYYSFADEGFL